MEINDIIAIGGGESIQEGLALGLKDRLRDKFVITINYAYKHFDSTFMCYSDKAFYFQTSPQEIKDYPNIREELSQLPLIIALDKNECYNGILLPNTMLIHHPRGNEISSILTGIFALELAEFFNPKNIFLLGYDWAGNHYYGQEVLHRGNKTDSKLSGFFKRHDPGIYFPKLESKTINIYNVSPQSSIKNFTKISYIEMFDKLSPEIINQDDVRTQIKKQLLPYRSQI